MRWENSRIVWIFDLLVGLSSAVLVVQLSHPFTCPATPLAEWKLWYVWAGWSLVVVAVGLLVAVACFLRRGCANRLWRLGAFFLVALVALSTLELWQVRGVFREQRIDGPSMSPTLQGRHWRLKCPECRFTFAEPFVEGRSVTLCPLCQGLVRLTAHQYAHPLPGDRILIDRRRCTFPPRRWQVWAYRSRTDVRQAQVKRVVGLPGEHISLYAGDVWINGVISQKSLEETLSCATLVYDSRFSDSPHQRLRHHEQLLDRTRGPISHDGEQVVQGVMPNEHRHMDCVHWWVFSVCEQEPLSRARDDPNNTDFVGDGGKLLHTRENSSAPLADDLAPIVVPEGPGADVDQQANPPRIDAEPEQSSATVRQTPYSDWLWESAIDTTPDAILWWCYLGPAGQWVVQLQLATGTWAILEEQGRVVGQGTAAGRIATGAVWYFGFVDDQLLLVADHQHIVRHPVAARRSIPEAFVGNRFGRVVDERAAHLVLRNIGFPYRHGDVLALGSPRGELRVRYVRVWRDIYYVNPQGLPTYWHACTTGSNEYFLLGDNTVNSLDSRQGGPVDRSWLLGRVVRCR